jgi:hypothetical protein
MLVGEVDSRSSFSTSSSLFFAFIFFFFEDTGLFGKSAEEREEENDRTPFRLNTNSF